MVSLKSEREIEMMHASRKLLAATHKEIAKLIKPGITTNQMEAFVEARRHRHDRYGRQFERRLG